MTGLADEWAAMRPAGGYGLIMADPPWAFRLRSRRGEKRAAQAHYDCMDLEAIMDLPVEELAAPDAVCWLWCTNPLLPQALLVLEAWGFEFRTHGAWFKYNAATGKLAIGTGYLLRSAHETFLIGVRGRPRCTRGVRSAILARRREHSRKPDEAFAAAERLMPEARRIELFSRQRRPGWDAWGLEADRFGEVVA